MSYQVIARKYRPQIFDEVVGQRLVSETLKNAILTNRVAHGYIFSGARGVGKTTMARILAKALNCVHGPTAKPCGECPSCVEIAAGNSIDVLEIDAASNRGIDEMRELRENVRYLPARDRYKVFIIDEVHMLTTEAFNALLKTLEEPPERSLFILATTEAHKLPATIQSRCQHFAFRLLDYAEILSRLKEICTQESVRAAEGALSAIAQAAEGSLRDALSLLDEVIAACGQEVTENRVQQLLGVVPAQLLSGMVRALQAGDAQRVLEQVDQLAGEGQDLTTFCGELMRYVRNLMIARSCGGGSPLLQIPDSERAGLEELAKSLSEEDLTRFFQILLRAQSEMRYALQPRFHLELALIKLAHAPKLASLESLLSTVQKQQASVSGPARSGGGGPAAPSPRNPEPSQPSRPARPGVGEPAAPRTPVPPWKRSSPAAPQNAAKEASAPAEPASSSAASETSDTALAEAVTAPASGDARLEAIKAVLFEESKFLSSCLNPVAGWRFENGQVHFLYSRDGSWAADLLKGREHQEKLRAACEKVLGQPVKIYVTLGTETPQAAPAPPSAQERALRDPAVELFQKRFDCVLTDVTDLSRG
ncbi:MAG TPA: DNA polymerase III subunit gamma/tau [Terriglobia bacterium]|nr:DNA polymerase III subunit gamma/tau [Terriglobia bacterium]